MDRRLRRAPDTEWVLMYRLGLSRQRIADLVRAEPATVGYHRVIARRRDPGLEAAHLAAAVTKAGPSPADHACMEEIIAWITAGGRSRATAQGTMLNGRWPALATAGAKQPRAHWTRGVPGRTLPGPRLGRKPQGSSGRGPWHDRLAQLMDFRADGNDWPRHHDYASARQHTLGVWIHTQRYKHRGGDLDPDKVALLDAAVPGWQTGRTRGRRPRV